MYGCMDIKFVIGHLSWKWTLISKLDINIWIRAHFDPGPGDPDPRAPDLDLGTRTRGPTETWGPGPGDLGLRDPGPRPGNMSLLDVVRVHRFEGSQE